MLGQNPTDVLIRSLIQTGRDATAEEVDQWDLIEQVDYIEEWTPKEEVVAHPRRLVKSPEATEEQRQRYEQLDQLMRTNRPILERLRAS